MNDQAFQTMAVSPKSDPPRRSNEERPAEPPAPGPDQAPHEHPDDPGVHPDGPKRYHDDHAAPARQQHEPHGQHEQQELHERCEQGEPA